MGYKQLLLCTYFGCAVFGIFFAIPAMAAKSCPAPAACQKFSTQEDECQDKNKKACRYFVKTFKKLLPKYDCQRPFDSVSTEKYVVPAVWLCDNYESALKLLSRLNSPDAKRLFGSEELQAVLDGDMARAYLEKSQKVAKQLHAKQHPPKG